MIRLSLQFTFVGFGAIVFGSPELGLCQEGVSCIHLFHFASIHLSREPGEYSVASGTNDLLDSRLNWFNIVKGSCDLTWLKPKTSSGNYEEMSHLFGGGRQGDYDLIRPLLITKKIICNAAAEVQDVKFGI